MAKRRSYVGVVNDAEDKRRKESRAAARKAYRDALRDVSFIGTFDEFLSDAKAPAGFKRADAAREAYESAVNDGVFIGPLKDFLDDDKARKGFDRASKAEKSGVKPSSFKVKGRPSQSRTSAPNRRAHTGVLGRILHAGARTAVLMSKGIVRRSLPGILRPVVWNAALRSNLAGSFAGAVYDRVTGRQYNRYNYPIRKDGAGIGKGSLDTLKLILREIRFIRRALGIKPSADMQSKVEKSSLEMPSALEETTSIVKTRWLSRITSKGLSKIPKPVAATGARVAGIAGRAAVAATASVGSIISGLAALIPFFLPKDIKSLLGGIFEGILEGLGFKPETVEAVLAPFRMLSDIAEGIKSFLGFVWDVGTKAVGVLKKLFSWFTSGDKKDAAAEVQKGTGASGHGEFVTGAPEQPTETKPGTPVAKADAVPPKKDPKEFPRFVQEKQELLTQIQEKKKAIEKVLANPKTEAPNATGPQLANLKQNLEVLKLRETQIQRELTFKSPNATHESETIKHGFILKETRNSFTTIDKNLSTLTGKTQEPRMRFWNADGAEIPAPETSGVTPETGKTGTDQNSKFQFWNEDGKEISFAEASAKGKGAELITPTPTVGTELAAGSERVEQKREEEGDVTIVNNDTNNSQNVSGGDSGAAVEVPEVVANRDDLDRGLFFYAGV